MREVTEEEALKDGFTGASGVLSGLREYYPDLAADDRIVLVRFDVDAA